MAAPTPMCPLRPGEGCYLCVPGTTGPHDCPTVAEVMRDAELRSRLVDLRAEHRANVRL